jgi:hypothetical protein
VNGVELYEEKGHINKRGGSLLGWSQSRFLARLPESDKLRPSTHLTDLEALRLLQRLLSSRSARQAAADRIILCRVGTRCDDLTELVILSTHDGHNLYQ